MRLAKVWIQYNRRVNLGDYNHVDISFGASAELEPGDDSEKVMTGLWDMAKTNVKAQILPLAKKDAETAAKVQELFLGLPIINYQVEGMTPTDAEVARFMENSSVKYVHGQPPQGDDQNAEKTSGATAGFIPAE